MRLGRILTLVWKHPFISCFLIVFLIFLFGEYYPNYFEQLNLKKVALYPSLVIITPLLTGYVYKGGKKSKYKHKQEDNHGEELD